MTADTTHRTTARLAVYLDDMYFPCSRREILERAEDNEAPDALLDAIEELPERKYWSIRDILVRVQGGAELVGESSEAAILSVPASGLAARPHAPALSPRP